MSERKSVSQREVNQELWEKAKIVSKGIMTLIWAHTQFYIEPFVVQELNEAGIYNVYITDYGKFAVRLDDGSEYFLIQPCPWLIYELYESKFQMDNSGICNEETTRKAEAYDKFNNFFEFMVFYAGKRFC
ncbi:MAG: hypothetical protein IKD77_00490 [Bacilli bacterium]|nr:hypothetical protein [Bacilli bacterium]